ncbi:hypothetical protein IUQ79_02840 [Mycobacteroides abscessus subsp. bolletii]|uniref:hypothetical protein n=1 Tax=Mycobacteroides abscessus TaxID=36809 RepID=UPI0019D0D9EA|nr:hypothetical protein [Mycobacteroides abscessus]MBN7300821.1 hypothetical protein [Mycobacteroides abscessus subsp. bolletii]
MTTLRDLDDPALDDESVSQLAWYHTSTYPDWPSPRYLHETRHRLESLRRPTFQYFDSMLHNELSKALHVGTYESAIENMLRRMRNQSDASSHFYLHRVALRIASSELGSLRNENAEKVSRLLVHDLTARRLTALRYVNVYESPGSISLAIDPIVIEYVQSIPIPVRAGLQQPTAEAVAAVAAAKGAIAIARSRMPVTAGIDKDDLDMRVLIGEPGDTVAEKINACNDDLCTAWTRLRTRLSDQYLDGVSPTVQQRFVNSIGTQSNRKDSDSPHDYHERFRSYSTLLTAGAYMRNAIADQPTRTATIDIYP